MLKDKIQAFFIHFVASVLVCTTLFGVIVLSWFPGEFIYAGGLHGLKIITGIDIVLGPLLTFVVYKKGKAGLKLDLALIVILQISCLVWGIWIINNERPVAQILMDDHVQLVTHSDAKHYSLDLSSFPGRTPKPLMMKLPADVTTWDTVLFASGLADEKPFVFRSELYLTLDSVSSEDYRERISRIVARSDVDMSSISQLGAGKNCEWIPIKSQHTKGFACFSHVEGIVRFSERKLW